MFALLAAYAAPRPLLAEQTRVVAIYASREARSAGAAPVRNITEERRDLPGNNSAHKTLHTGEYNESEAIDLAYFSQITYCGADQIRSWECAECSRWETADLSVFEDDTYDAQAFVVYDKRGGRIVVAFRGSHTLTNWLLNFEFDKTSHYPLCDGCLVHSGFLKTWESIRDAVTNATKALVSAHPSAKLYITGHSMGGSLAALAAAHFAFSQRMAVHRVYTFGEPRVGNEAFREFYNSGARVSWRLTHYKDPVPHLPPQAFGFHHIATEVFYNEASTSYQQCDGSGEDPNCSDAEAWDSLLFVSDHCSYLKLPICSPVCSV